MKIIKQAVIFTIVSFALIAGVSLVYAWTGPTQSPPDGNVDAPVNVSNSTQYKSGAFGVGGLFRGYSNAVFDGNVLIGISSPFSGSAKVNISSPDYSTAALKWGVGSQKIGFLGVRDGNTALVGADSEGNDIILRAGNADRFIIKMIHQ